MNALTEIDSARLVLRRLEADDAAALFRTVGDPDVMRYWLPGPDKTVEDTYRRIAEIEDHWRQHGFGDWAAVTKPDGQIIGFGGLHYIADMPEVNVGYAVQRTHWGRGFGSELCRRVLDHGFAELRLSPIVAVIDPRNPASIAVATRCGLRFWKRFVWTGQERVAYSATSSDWRSK